MKKILVMLFVMALCIAMLTGCDSNTGDTDVIGSSDVVAENTESSAEDTSMNGETGTADGEVIDSSESISEEESEGVEETVMFSADEVMAHIDALIAEYTYNDPEHIKCLVIAANLDYISEEDLNTILAEYGYTMEELAALYIGEGGPMYSVTISYARTQKYYSSGGDSGLDESERYENRITLESIMLNDADKEFAKKMDDYFIASSVLDRVESNASIVANSYDAVTSGEKVVVSYVKFIFGYDREYNPYNDYLNVNS